MLVPAEAMVAVEEINVALEKLRESRESLRSQKRQAPGLIDALLLHEYEKCVSDDVEEDSPPLVECDLDMLKWCWNAASSAYGFAMLKGLGMLKGVNPSIGDYLQLDDLAIRHRCGEEWVVLKKSTSTLLRPDYFVAHSKKRSTVVVAVRGTSGIGDILLDLTCVPALLEPNRLGHGGMIDAAKRIVNETADAIEEADADFLVFTGHSMGGGIALLASCLARSCFERIRNCTKIKGVAFAPPPVVTTDEDFDDCISVYVEDDVIPHLSLRSVLNFVGDMDKLDQALSPWNRFSLLVQSKVARTARTIWDETSEWRDEQQRRLVDTVRQVLDDDPKAATRIAAPETLRVPGYVYRLSRSGTSGRRICYHEEPVIKIKDRSLLDHLPTSIESALTALFNDDDDSSDDDEYSDDENGG